MALQIACISVVDHRDYSIISVLEQLQHISPAEFQEDTLHSSRWFSYCSSPTVAAQSLTVTTSISLASLYRNPTILWSLFKSQDPRSDAHGAAEFGFIHNFTGSFRGPMGFWFSRNLYGTLWLPGRTLEAVIWAAVLDL